MMHLSVPANSRTLQILDEDRNRCIILATDESPAQTKRIIINMARRKTKPGETGVVDSIIRRHHAAQRLLFQCRVGIPFADRLAELHGYAVYLVGFRSEFWY